MSNRFCVDSRLRIVYSYFPIPDLMESGISSVQNRVLEAVFSGTELAY